MPSQESILLVVLAGFALSASPGPSMLYVLSRSLGQDRNAGLASAAGLATGGVVHAVAAALGLSALLTYSPELYRAVTVLGAAYLVYLGIQMYRSRNDEVGETEAGTRPGERHEAAGRRERDEGGAEVLAAEADVRRQRVARGEVLDRASIGRDARDSAVHDRGHADVPLAVDRE